MKTPDTHASIESPQDPGGPLDVAELTPGRRDQILDAMAEAVARRRLETPAIFFLELHKPLTTVAAAAVTFSKPTLGCLFGFKRMAEWAALLEDRENLESLIRRIEKALEKRQTGCST